ncbi:Non-repetitive/WGA-negative nucleoporin C-terminal-domain-containing protein [Paraphysoderma sedebokerense]|nr:Non-repetitive/WGA-negative nucleoporin C-terminal-domain-containing protein [Paraphysoderma sedebokerense]
MFTGSSQRTPRNTPLPPPAASARSQHPFPPSAVPSQPLFSSTPNRPSPLPHKRTYSDVPLPQSFGTTPKQPKITKSFSRTPGSVVDFALESSSTLAAQTQRIPYQKFQTETATANVIARLPEPVLDLLNSARQYDTSLSNIGVAFHTKTHQVAVYTNRICYFWNYRQASTHSPVYRTLEFPPRNAHTNDPPFVSFVSGTSDPDLVGLLVCTVVGEFWYWDNLSLERKEPLTCVYHLSNDFGVSLANCEPAGFVYATLNRQIVKISLMDSNNQPALSWTEIGKQTSGSLLNIGLQLKQFIGFGKDARNEGALVMKIAPGLSDYRSRDLLLLTAAGYERWTLSLNQSDRFVESHSVVNSVEKAIFDKGTNDAQHQDDLNVVLEDINVTRSGDIILLASYINTYFGREFEICWAVCILEGRSTDVKRVSILKYKVKTDNRDALGKAQLLVPSNGAGVIVQFRSAVALTTVHEATSCNDILQMDKSNTLLLGSSAIDYERPGDLSKVVVLKSDEGILEFELDVAKILRELEGRDNRGPSVPTDQNEKIKDTLENFVYHEWDLSNIELHGNDLTVPATKLSSEILQSTSELKYLPDSMALHEQIREKKIKLSRLVTTLNAARAIERISLRGRYQLLWNYEKVTAAEKLWNFQNALMGFEHELASHVFKSAIMRFLDQIHIANDDIDLRGSDPVRYFFRRQIPRIEGVISTMQDILGHSQNVQSGTLVHHMAVYEGNWVLLAMLKSALEERQSVMYEYGITRDDASDVEAWTETQNILTALQSQYKLTTHTLNDLYRSQASINDYGMLTDTVNFEDPNAIFAEVQQSPIALYKVIRRQLFELADMLYVAFKNRLLWLQRSERHGEYRNFTNMFESLRQDILKPLVAHGLREEAYDIAERHRDYQTLVDLCINDTNERDQTDRIKNYLSTLDYNFAKVLYSRYSEQGQLRTLLEQSPSHADLLLLFLKQEDVGTLSWIQEINMKKYEDAGQTLLDLSQIEDAVEQRKIAFSLAKLAHLANKTLDQLENDETVEYIDNSLDNLQRQSRLHEEFQSTLPSNLRIQPIEVQAEYIFNLAFQSDKLKLDRPDGALILSFIKRLLDCKVISDEDLIDVLTLKKRKPENMEETVEDIVSVFYESKTIPDSRRLLTVQTIIRRIILSDGYVFVFF